MNRRELRQYNLNAIKYFDTDHTLSGATKESLLRRLTHRSESALTRCQITEIEASDVRQKYAGKRASRAKLSEARVADNVEVV